VLIKTLNSILETTMNKTLLALSALILLQMPLHAQLAAGTVVSGSATIGAREFALPPGTWKVVATSDQSTTIGGVDRNGSSRSIYLVQTDQNNRFVAAMTIHTTLASVAGITGWTSEPCKRTDTLYRDKLDGNIHYPACLLINHYTNFWQGGIPTDAFGAQIWTWFHDNKVELPYTTIMSEYTKYFAGDYVVARAWLNPDVAGISPAPRVSWNASPWHPALIKNDPTRLAYIESVKSWSNALVASSRESLMTGKSAAPLPPLPALEQK
jgi:hypothetical protein